jgi:hypothetical protein
MTARDETRRKLNRYAFYNNMILIVLAIAAGRIAVVSNKQGDAAFLSANDRSRWCTVACLVERGTFAIDQQIEITDPIKRHYRPWDTIDKVRHLGSDGKQHYYSSKPPLFSAMVAVVYKGVNLATGLTLTEQPKYAMRIVLALVNLPLLAIFCFATIYSIERVCRSEWAKQLATLATCFGTMLLPFSISLNNHLPAAAATAVAIRLYLYAAERLDSSFDGATNPVRSWVWLLAGVAAAFAAANELPALTMTVLWFVLFAWLDRGSILPFIAGVAIVAVAFFSLNWVAHESFRPPYAHRGNGELISSLARTTETPDMELAKQIRQSLHQQRQIPLETELRIEPSDESNRWVVYAGEPMFALCKSDNAWELRDWDDWYEYPNTYWKDGKRAGVDVGEPSRLVYFLQFTIGHHGLFSITPIWLLVPIGLVFGLSFGPHDFRRLVAAVLLATCVCLLFYLTRPLIDRNYGGVSVCFRWMLWFTPLWLLVISPVLEVWSESRKRRIAVQVMLAISVFSTSIALTTPWQSPWIYQFWQFLGWIGP